MNTEIEKEKEVEILFLIFYRKKIHRNLMPLKLVLITQSNKLNVMFESLT